MSFWDGAQFGPGPAYETPKKARRRRANAPCWTCPECGYLNNRNLKPKCAQRKRHGALRRAKKKRVLGFLDGGIEDPRR